MIYNKNIELSHYIDHHTLLYGETNAGKTHYTAKFVQFLLEAGYNPKEISILDFAPNLEMINNRKIGGKIVDFYGKSYKCNNIIIQGEIIPPRLTSKNEEELLQITQENHKKIMKIIKIYNRSPTPTLIMNDISIFLHLGDKDYLLDTIKKATTFFGNSYYGTSITNDFSKSFSLKEQKNVEFIINNIEQSYLTE